LLSQKDVRSGAGLHSTSGSARRSGRTRSNA
jgi:hypothetical protein